MPDVTAAEVKLALSRTNDQFDQLYPGLTDRFATTLASAFSHLLDAVPKFGEEPVASRRVPPNDQYSVAWHVLWDACNGLLGAFSLLQRGSETETLAASRVSVERVAVALVLVDNPGVAARFVAHQENRLATRAIGPARKVIPQLAKTWGALSDVGSHVGPDNVGTSVGTRPPNLQMVIGGRLSADAARGFREGASFLTDVAALLAEWPARIFFDEKRARAVL